MITPRFRKPRPYGKRSEVSETTEPKKRFYIVCEGQKTENQYFNGIFNYRTQLKINQLVDIIVMEQAGEKHVPHPVHIVNACINLIQDDQEGQNHLIDYDPSIDEIWVIFDRDPRTLIQKQYDYIYRKCEEYGIYIGLTNPTFEFWLLLHLPGADQYPLELLRENRRVGGKKSKRFVEKELSVRLENGYKKSDIQFSRFLPHIELAIEQEKHFKQTLPEIYQDVGSNIGVLISKIINH